jgi:hypothetical protein
MPAEQRAQLNPEEVKRFSQAMVTTMNGQAQAGAWYRYDSENRLTTTRERNLFEETTTISYNTEGEKAEEQINLTFNSTILVRVPHRIDEEGRLIPVKPNTEPHHLLFLRNHPAFPTLINTTAMAIGSNRPAMILQPPTKQASCSSAFRGRYSSHSPVGELFAKKSGMPY